MHTSTSQTKQPETQQTSPRPVSGHWHRPQLRPSDRYITVDSRGIVCHIASTSPLTFSEPPTR